MIFNNEALKVEGYSDDITLTDMMAGLKDEKFLWSLGKKTPVTYTELLARAQKYMSAGELLSARKAPDEGGISKQSEHKKRDRTEDLSRSTERHDDEKRKRSGDQLDKQSLPPSKFKKYTPTTVPIEQLLMEIQDKNIVRWPARMMTASNKRNKNKYCLFHKDHGHTTSDCFDLKEEIETLIQKGYLKEFVRGKRDGENQDRDDQIFQLEK